MPGNNIPACQRETLEQAAVASHRYPAAIGLLRNTTILFLFLMLGCVLYDPPAGWCNRFYVGGGSDPWIYIWCLNWWPFAFHHHLSPLFTAYVDAPVGVSLSWKTTIPTLALPLAPLIRSFGAIAVYNSVMLAAPGLAAWGAYLCAFEMTQRTAPSIMAGLAFGFSTYETAQHLAHLNLAFVCLVPIILTCCLRAAKRRWGSLRLGTVLGPLLALEFGVSQEVFATSIVFGVILLLVVAFIDPARRPLLKRLAPGFITALLTCLLIIAPLLWQMIRWYGTGMSGISSPSSGSSDLLGLIIPTPLTLIGGHIFVPITRHFVGGLEEQGSYLGLPLLTLLAYIVYSNRSEAVIRIAGASGLIAIIFSLGPYLHVSGLEMSTAPWIAFSSLPFLKAMLPVRFVVYAWLAVAVLLAMWLAAPDAGFRRWMMVGCALLFVVPNPSVVRRWTAVTTPHVFRNAMTARLLPRDTRVLILPEWGEALSYQLTSGMRFKLAGQGYLSSGVPEPFARWHLFPSLFDNQFNKIDPVEFDAYLANYHVDYIVVMRPGFTARVAPAFVQATREAAGLLRAAGWQDAWTTPDAIIFRPARAQSQPTNQAVATYMTEPSPQHMAKMVKNEKTWVCGIRTVAAIVDVNPRRFLKLYTDHVHPPLPIATFDCK